MPYCWGSRRTTLKKEMRRFEEQLVEAPWWETEVAATSSPLGLHASWLRLTSTTNTLENSKHSKE